MKKYICELTPDTNTINTTLKLFNNNRTVTCVGQHQPYPDHPDRFDVGPQLLYRNGLTGRCYWEVEWTGGVLIAVSYRGIGRKGDSSDCLFGFNDQSWTLDCSALGYHVRHNGIRTSIPSSSYPLFFPSSASNRVVVYVDCPAGILSFYRVSSGTLIHLHTFNITFTQPLYPGFGLWPGASVSLCPPV